MPAAATFHPAQLEQICQILAHTVTGLAGSEIGRLLAQLRINDPDPTLTKWKRLFEALSAKQHQDRCGNAVVAFIHAAMAPVRYSGRSEVFEARREDLNTVLAFCGLTLRPDGKLQHRTPAQTLTEAEQRAQRLRSELTRRGVHADVIRFCQAEYLRENSFHAVLEASKSVADKIRRKSGLAGDGASLVDAALGGDTPILAINALQTETERGEQRGFATLLRGLFGTFRNPTAHEARIYWPMREEDALDLLSLASYAHRRLDAAVNTRTFAQ